jgi:polyadenylate-binding protein 2
MCNKQTGHPLGYAYIEFEKEEGVEKAIELMNDSLFKGRQITVNKKRKNLPGKGSRGGYRGGRFPRYGMPMFYGGRRPNYGRYRPY